VDHPTSVVACTSLELTRLVLDFADIAPGLASGDVARSSVVFQPLLDGHKSHVKNALDQSFQEGVACQGSFHSDQG